MNQEEQRKNAQAKGIKRYKVDNVYVYLVMM